MSIARGIDRSCHDVINGSVVMHLAELNCSPCDTSICDKLAYVQTCHISVFAQVEAALEALSSVDDVTVVRSGDASNAYDFG